MGVIPREYSRLLTARSSSSHSPRCAKLPWENQEASHDMRGNEATRHGVQLTPVVPSLFQQSPPLRCLAVRTNSSLICARCGSTLSQRGRMYGLNQASVSSLCRVWDVSVSLSPKGITACIELPSQTTCKVFTRSPGIHLGSSFTSVAMLFGGGWTSTGEDCRATRGCLAASHAGHQKFRAAYRGLLRRVGVPEMTWQDVVFLDGDSSSPGIS